MNEHKNLFHYLADWQQARQASSRTPKSWNRWLPAPGNIIFSLLLVGLLILTQRVWATPGSAATNAVGASATTINYQGRLAAPDGSPKDGTFGMSFALWDAATGGSIVWGPESHSAVPVTDGLFNVGLGSQTSSGIPTTVWNGDRYLEITVSGETLAPRELIRSVPIAGLALTVPDSAIQSRHVSLNSGGQPATGNLSLTTSMEPVPGMSFTLTPETAQTYNFFLVVEFAGSSATPGYGAAKLFVDGLVAGSGRGAITDWNSELGTVAQIYQVDLSPGEHTIEVKAHSSEGGGSL